MAYPGVIQNAYLISNKGRVYSTLLNRFLSIHLNSYYKVTLGRVDGTYNDCLIHRLLMIGFRYIPGCENLEVNHIDGNKLNNSLDNLEWVTHKRNMQHAAITGLMPSRFTIDQINTIIELYTKNEMGYTEISKIFNCPPATIYDIISRNNIVKRSNRKITEEDRLEMCKLYKEGKNFIEIEKIIGFDRSTIGKELRKMSKMNSYDISVTPLKRFTESDVHKICQIFSQYKGQGFTMPYKVILESMQLEKNESNRKGINNIYNRKCYTKISSQYDF